MSIKQDKLKKQGSRIAGLSEEQWIFRQELNNLKAQVNNGKHFIKRLQAVCKKIGYSLFGISFIILNSDIIAKALVHTSLFSIQYNDELGLFQILAVVVFGSMSILLLTFGYWRYE